MGSCQRHELEASRKASDSLVLHRAERVTLKQYNRTELVPMAIFSILLRKCISVQGKQVGQVGAKAMRPRGGGEERVCKVVKLDASRRGRKG